MSHEEFVKIVPIPASIQPENIKVSVKDNVMTVEMRTELKSEDGSFSSEGFMTQFTLPAHIDISRLSSTWSGPQGLRITAPYLEGRHPQVQQQQQQLSFCGGRQQQQQQQHQLCDSSSALVSGLPNRSLTERDKWTIDVPIVQGIDPMKLNVTVRDNVMTIEAKMSTETADNPNSSTQVCQEFTSRITLPPNINISQLTSTWTKDGTLRVDAPFLK